jgi:heat shock protein HspQ
MKLFCIVCILFYALLHLSHLAFHRVFFFFTQIAFLTASVYSNSNPEEQTQTRNRGQKRPLPFYHRILPFLFSQNARTAKVLYKKTADLSACSFPISF